MDPSKRKRTSQRIIKSLETGTSRSVQKVLRENSFKLLLQKRRDRGERAIGRGRPHVDHSMAGTLFFKSKGKKGK